MEWISVKDRLPEEGDKVIGYGKWIGEISTYEDVASIECGVWVGGRLMLSSDYYSAYLEDITHWMPMPPTPKD